METVDWFGSRDEDSYRDEAKNILDSYAHPWDVLAELAQNAVDAIDQARQADGSQKSRIDIEIDHAERFIRVLDNGTGINGVDLRSVLRPHFSRKRGKSMRGEKGVGLTYIALIGNDFEILTKTNEALQQARVKGSQDWLRGGMTRPEIVIETVDKDPYPALKTFTRITVKDIPEPPVAEEELDIFSLDFEQTSHLLRTRTAIGYTGALFGHTQSAETEVTLAIKSKDGTTESKAIPFAFESPSTFLPKKMVISLDQVKDYLVKTEEKKIFGKSIEFTRLYSTKAGKEVKAYCFLSSRHFYTQQTESLKLPDDISIRGGIYVTTKGMPTGITLPTPKTGNAGYWPNFFLVLEYDSITLDLGRKSITAPRIVEMLGRQAVQMFHEVERYIKYILREDLGTLDALMSQGELQEELSDVRREAVRIYKDNRQGNKVPEVYPFTREPKQEQDVIAIFSMALARGLFPYELMRLSSNYRYDSFLKITIEKKQLSIVAEFKLHGESIVKDLNDAKVRYGQLNLLICWKMNESKLRAAGFIIDAVEEGKRELPGATHRLSFPTSSGIKDQPISVICLADMFIHEE